MSGFRFIHQLAFCGDGHSNTFIYYEDWVKQAVSHSISNFNLEQIGGVTRNDLLNLVRMKGGLNVGRPISLVRRQCLVIEAYDEIAAVSVAQSHATDSNLCLTPRTIEVKPSF
ncbi:hypothetical protein D3C71_1420480 [compost metagenome]